MKTIERIMYNSRYSKCEIGKDGVASIEYHPAMGEGDRHYCTVHFEDGDDKQIFDLDEIFWRPE